MMRKCVTCDSIFNTKENSTTCLSCGSKRTIEIPESKRKICFNCKHYNGKKCGVLGIKMKSINNCNWWNK